jgi:superoxide reductase
VVEVKDGVVKVHVGSIDHPMVEEHWIEWIYLETDQGSQVEYLKANEVPEVEFVLGKEKPLVVYAYCNLHGLWKTDIK